MHDDQWDGYPAERTWLIRRMRSANAGGRTVLLSGDVHSSWAFTGPSTRGRARCRGRVHDAGGVIGGDGPGPVPGAVARGGQLVSE